MKIWLTLAVFGLAAASPAQESDPAVCALDGLPVADLALQGLRYTRPAVVHSLLVNRPGNPFSCEYWHRERNRLRDLGIFAAVELEAKEGKDGVTLIYRFRELPPYVPLLSIHNTEQDGLSLGPHLSAVNLLGTGKKARVLARFLGTTEYLAALSGRQVWGQPLAFDVLWKKVDSYNRFESFHEDAQILSAQGIWDMTRLIGLAAGVEWLRIRADTPGITLRREGDFVPRLGIGLVFDSRDRKVLPRGGSYAEFRLTQSGGILGGPADYREWLGDWRGYAPLSTRNILGASVLARYRTDGPMGRYDRFHAGGVNTLRGHDENALQGRNEFLLGVWYGFDLLREQARRIPLFERWSVHYALQAVAGADAAGLWDEAGLPGDPVFGIYFGLHLLVPGVERLRAEVGTGGARLDLRLHLGLFEKTNAQRLRTR